MKVSTSTGPFVRFGDMKQIVKLLSENGFTAYDCHMFRENQPAFFADDYLAWAKDLRAYADEIGIPCNQSHAPFPSIIKGNDEYNEKTFPLLIRALEVSGVLGAEVCVIHPCNDYTAEENAEFYKKLEPYARQYGVKIGVENMWNWWKWDRKDGHVLPAACSHQDDFLKHLQLLNSDVFVACVDIGHAEMMHAYGTNAVKIIETLGDRVQAMHLHDVDLVNDLHTTPFNSKIDYAPIIAALKKVGYKGDITLEAGAPAGRVPVELMPAATRYMAEVATYFKMQIEKE